MQNRKNALILLCPKDLMKSPPNVVLPEGYQLRTFKQQDFGAYRSLLALEGWELSDEQIHSFLDLVLPDGLYLITDTATGEIVATASAVHNPRSTYYHFPFGGDIGYVITKQGHRGKKLGFQATVQATRRLIEAGYKCIRIVTNDHRLPALKTYLNVGYKPFLYSEDMEDRWRRVYTELGLSFSIAACIKNLKEIETYG